MRPFSGYEFEGPDLEELFEKHLFLALAIDTTVGKIGVAKNTSFSLFPSPSLHLST